MRLCVLILCVYVCVMCALGFNGGETEIANPYNRLHVDIMHQYDLGVFKTLVDILRILARPSTIKSRSLHLMDKCLLCIKKKSRYQSFQIPITNKWLFMFKCQLCYIWTSDNDVGMRLLGVLCGRSLMIFKYINWIGCYNLLVQSFINFLTTNMLTYHVFGFPQVIIFCMVGLIEKREY